MTFFYNLNDKLNSIRAKPETTHKQLNERDMSRAAKGYEKYGEKGMEALAKAGREGKALDPIRKKFDKYDNTEVDEGLGSIVQKMGKGIKSAAGRTLDTLGHGSDEDLIRGMQKKAGAPQTGKKPMAVPRTPIAKEEYGPLEEEPMMSPKQKSFAKLAPPTNKITFADKIAGAKKEVDEMLGDVAAEAMKSALGRGKKVVADKAEDNSPFTAHKRPRIEKPAVGTITRGSKHDVEEIPGGRRVTRRVDPSGISVGADDEAAQSGEKRGRGRPAGKGAGKSIGAKGPSGRSKLMTKEAVGEDDIEVIERLMDNAFAEGNKALGNALQDALERIQGDQDEDQYDDDEQVNEKAVSKKQQKFMGMVHAAQKGKKPASKEVAKTAKSMGKKDAEDFASTKHKGLPEKKKPEDKKKEKEVDESSTTAGSVAPSAGSKGSMSFGKGIYDSMNRELEQMISESMNISMNMTNDTHGGPSKSLTVTATDEDAVYLGKLLKMSGIGGESSGCGCGSSPCSCGSNAEVVDENSPDWPTNTETSDNALQYAGGLNKPKSTGQTTVPVIASQDDRQDSYAAEEEDALHRMMEMAGVKKKEVDEEKTEEGNKFTGNLAKARADGKKQADLDGDGDMEKVRESIFDLTNQWKAYKG